MTIIYIALGVLVMAIAVLLLLTVAWGIINVLDEIVDDCTDFCGIADWLKHRKAKKRRDSSEGQS